MREAESHRRMLETLRRIADETDERHPYLGDSEARRARAALKALPEDADTRRKIALRLQGAPPELRLGNIRQAIDLLADAQRLAGAPDGDPTTKAEVDLRLGVAYLRLGEVQNCAARHTEQSCIAPIGPRGQHTDREGSTLAMVQFRSVLENSRAGLTRWMTARWLLNIAAMTLGGYPDLVPEAYRIDPAAFRSAVEFPHFVNVAPKLGLDTFNLSGGAIVDDFDNDGYLDILTSTWDTRGGMRYFRNEQDGRFSDRTKAAGLTGLYGGLNMVHADYDNDGHLDVFVLRGAWLREKGRHPNSLLRNRGDGTFVDVTYAAGLAEVNYPTKTAAWADYDNDGDVDLFIGNETSEQIDAPCQLFRNNGDGSFTDVAASAGVQDRRFVLATVWGDYDGDRWPDLYVAGTRPNRLYNNNGDGSFTDVAEKAGVTGPRSAFPSWFWDFDNDGKLDLFVSSSTGPIEMLSTFPRGLGVYATNPAIRDLQQRALPHVDLSRLYKGDGKGGFRDVAREQGLVGLDLPMGANFGDLDNDGYLDFYLGTGDIPFTEVRPNTMYRNRRGQGFDDVTMAGGFGHLQKGHGVAFADIDNDGDSDVYEQMGGAFPDDAFEDALYENPGFGNHWITIKLIGEDSNRAAIGARIHARVVEDGQARSIYRYVDSGGSFGCNPFRQTIGLGRAETVRRLEIYWPTTGKTQILDDVPADQVIEIREGRDGYKRMELRKLRLGRLGQ